MRPRFKPVASILALGLLAGSFGSVPAGASHNADDHSKNIKQLVQAPTRIAKAVFAQGSDLAFQRRLIVAGTYQGTALYRILRRKPFVKQIGFHQCPGSQGDVSVWGRLAFVSIDSAPSNNGDSSVCNNTKARGPGDAVTPKSTSLEGLRIINIRNRRQPRQVGFVQTDCGSHTHTLVPHRGKLYAYIESYPLRDASPNCNAAVHRKIQIVEIKKRNPAKSDVVGTFDVTPAIGCHDVTVFPKKDLAAAACISESQIWNIANPKKPKLLAHVENPEGMQIAHSSAFTWDGKYAIFSDEYGGAAGGGGCTGDEDSNVGAMFFYKIRNPRQPELMGHHSLPRVPPVDEDEATRTFRCTTHNYNILPFKKRGRYVVVSSYYMGGLSAVRFTNPANATEIGHYLPMKGGVLPDMWSAYWYNGRIYANEHESQKGVSVYRMKGTGRMRVRYFKGRFNPQTQIPRWK